MDRWHNLLEVSAEEDSCAVVVSLGHALSKGRAGEVPSASAFQLSIKGLQRSHRKRGGNHVGAHQHYEIMRAFFCVSRPSEFLLVQRSQRDMVRIIGLLGKLVLDEFLQSWSAHLRDNQRTLVTPRHFRRHGEDNLITQILAEQMDLLNGLLEGLATFAAAAALPPVAQHLTLTQLLLKELIGLVDGVTKVGNPSVEHGVRGQQRKHIALVAQSRQRD